MVRFFTLEQVNPYPGGLRVDLPGRTLVLPGDVLEMFQAALYAAYNPGKGRAASGVMFVGMPHGFVAIIPEWDDCPHIKNAVIEAAITGEGGIYYECVGE